MGPLAAGGNKKSEEEIKIPKIAIQNYQFTIIIVILLVLSGIISLIRMPKSEDPAAAEPGASIFVIYPGAAPSDLEQLIVEPIEEVLNELDDIKKIESNCQDGLAAISIEFLAGSDRMRSFPMLLKRSTVSGKNCRRRFSD